MVSMIATQPTTIISCDEKNSIDFMFQCEVEFGSQEASNVEVDVVWKI